METKQAKSRQDTQKQELTPNYLHLCTRKKGTRMRGQHREKQEQLRQTGKENKHHLQVAMEHALSPGVKAQGRVFLSSGEEPQAPRDSACLQRCLVRASSEEQYCARSDSGGQASLKQHRHHLSACEKCQLPGPPRILP